ncbi:MAG TPA: HAD family hydrolase [Verrucomicrobiae bacterium]|nr:HAD family hydrolase [Verrucomicrobiae bacterium]
MIRLVLFDVDGTLVHTGGAGRNAFARTFAAAFNAYDGIHKVYFGGRTDISLARELFCIHGITPSPENFQKFFDHYTFCLDHVMQKAGGGACHGVLEFISELGKQPKPPMLGLLTGNIRLGAEIKLRRYGLWDHFETGGFADDGEDRNHIAAAALERGRRLLGANLAGEEVLVVGDTLHDIRCGRHIGARVLAVATGGAKLEELRQHKPDWAVEDLTRANVWQICNGAV